MKRLFGKRYVRKKSITDDQGPLKHRNSIDNYHFDEASRKYINTGQNLSTLYEHKNRPLKYRNSIDNCHFDEVSRKYINTDQNLPTFYERKSSRASRDSQTHTPFEYTRDQAHTDGLTFVPYDVKVRVITKHTHFMKKTLFNEIMYARGMMSNIKRLLRGRVHPLPQLKPMTERERTMYLSKRYDRMRKLQNDRLEKYFGDFKQLEFPINYTGSAGLSVTRPEERIVQAVPPEECNSFSDDETSHTTERDLLENISLCEKHHRRTPSTLGRKQMHRSTYPISLDSVSHTRNSSSSSCSSSDSTTAQRGH